MAGAVASRATFRLLLSFDECAGRRAASRAGEPQLAAPHHPKSATGRARRARPSLLGMPRSRFPKRAGPAFRRARGALERLGSARRLTRA